MTMKFKLFWSGWLALILLLLVAGKAQAQSGQCWNGNWTEPSCDPLTDLSCNVSPPLFSYATCLQGTSGELRIFKYNNDGNELDDISQNPAYWTQLMPGYIGLGDVSGGWDALNGNSYASGILEANGPIIVGNFSNFPYYRGPGDISVLSDIYISNNLRVENNTTLLGTLSVTDSLSSGNLVSFTNTFGGGSAATVLYLQQSGGDLGYFLKMDGWNSDIDVDYLGYFNSTGDFQIRIDRDGNSTNFFRINNGANSTVLEVDESGNLLAQGDITTNSQFCLGSDCINSWDNTGYWGLTGSDLYPSNTNWKIGVGTTTPKATLHIVGNTYQSNPTVNGTQISGGLIELVRDGNYPYIDFKNDISNSVDYDARFLLRNDNLLHLQGSSLSIGSYTSANTGSNGLVVSGRVGVGTSTPDAAYKLVVDGDAYSTGSWNSSDIRLKTDIKTLTNILDKVMEMRSVSFRWREDTGFNLPKGKQLGLIAQEVERYFPELVKTDSRGYKSLDYAKLTVVLLESIKEQQNIIDSLDSRIKKLEQIIINNQ